jgi:hypothetical protein
MKDSKLISILFYIAGVYDGILGIIFVFFPKIPFNLFNVTYPNHWGYIQFPAALLIIFGWMFFVVARKPMENRNLITYGIGLKFAYSVIVFGYWLSSGIPYMWKPFAVIDALMGILFIWAYFRLSRN